MTEKKHKRLYWLFKTLSVIISCAFPAWAILEKFPMWRTEGNVRALGVGSILMFIVILIVFRKSVFEFIRAKFNLHHAPPLAIWLTLIVISYILIFIGEFMRDLTTVFWMGLIGCTIGTVLTFIAENKFAYVKEKSDERA
jgi:amino acid transporter